MTCRHNDRATRYCSLKRAHTDLGYVLNCVAWAPTDEAEMRRLRDENRRLCELAEIMVHCMNDVDCDRCPVNGNPYEVRGEWAACDSLRDMLRESGIEVN